MTHAEDVPLSAPQLVDLAAEVLSKRPRLVLKAGIHLPLPASTAVFQQLREQWLKNKESAVDVLEAFCDASRFPLESLDLSGAELTNELLAGLLTAHAPNLNSVDLANITGVKGPAVNKLLDEANVALPKLRALRVTDLELLSSPPPPPRKFGQTQNPLPCLSERDLEGTSSEYRFIELEPMDVDYNLPCSSGGSMEEQADWVVDAEDDNWEMLETARQLQPLTARCPNVTSLYLAKPRRTTDEETREEGANDVISRICTPLKHLETLDLSHWTNVEDLRCLHPLNLTTLILYDVPDLYRAIDSIIALQNLRVLDVSQSLRETGTYPRPVSSLHKLVTNLKQLTHLDISSTNLASQPTPYDWPMKHSKGGPISSDIFGLRFLERKLIFLGLFNCDNASHYAEIPALHVAGDANENQVITALRVYSDRANLLQSVLNESYQLYRFGNTNTLSHHTEALHLVLSAMRVHLEDSTLQIAGSASLFYIIRKVNMNRNTKKQVVTALLNGMETHMDEQVMVRNCCLSLCQFEIPQEILFDYSRLATLLVTVLQRHNNDNLTQRIVVFLLNSMACHVEGDQKVQVGKFGAIEMILEQIKRKLASEVCDDVMEVGWSFLWNITDETPVNCDRFLKAGGLALFHKCYEKFDQETELVRNMMGLIGNIAEVDALRPQLMNADYIHIFCELLEIEAESIEISYNSAGVLAHMVSDGSAAWDALNVNRDDVMKNIVKATERWDLKARRFINYRSFRPILRLLPLWDSWASQHWAVWALANLTSTDGQKYCAYVADEGGVELLAHLTSDPRSTEEMKRLAQLVLDNIHKWKTKGLDEPQPIDSD